VIALSDVTVSVGACSVSSLVVKSDSVMIRRVATTGAVAGLLSDLSLLVTFWPAIVAPDSDRVPDVAIAGEQVIGKTGPWVAGVVVEEEDVVELASITATVVVA